MFNTFTIKKIVLVGKYFLFVYLQYTDCFPSRYLSRCVIFILFPSKKLLRPLRYLLAYICFAYIELTKIENIEHFLLLVYLNELN